VDIKAAFGSPFLLGTTKGSWCEEKFSISHRLWSGFSVFIIMTMAIALPSALKI